jgi:1,2-diacylglycerol 3-beta-galactosyltransferase
MNLPARDKLRILFLYSDTGGGHRAAAEAIIEAIELEFPGQVSTEMVDIFLQYAPPPINLAPRIYPRLSHMPAVWEIGYHVSDGRRRVRMAHDLLWPYVQSSITRLLQSHPCNLVVSVHQLINDPVARAAQANKTPFVTVVTDLVTTHAAWFCPAADLVIVPTQAAYRRGLELRMPATRMQVIGQPVADRYCHPAGDKVGLREQLGWRNDLPVALLVGGGEGMGPLAETAFAIDAARLSLQLVIVTGRNQALQQQMEKFPWQIPARVYGFTHQMPDFMRAADVLITKAGPGTISEGFIAGLPIILYSKMPGQEDGNVDYVVDEGAGIWAPRPGIVVETLRGWLDDPASQQAFTANALRLARPDAARRIARLLVEKAGLPVERDARN